MHLNLITQDLKDPVNVGLSRSGVLVRLLELNQEWLTTGNKEDSIRPTSVALKVQLNGWDAHLLQGSFDHLILDSDLKGHSLTHPIFT